MLHIGLLRLCRECENQQKENGRNAAYPSISFRHGGVSVGFQQIGVARERLRRLRPAPAMPRIRRRRREREIGCQEQIKKQERDGLQESLRFQHSLHRFLRRRAHSREMTHFPAFARLMLFVQVHPDARNRQRPVEVGRMVEP